MPSRSTHVITNGSISFFFFLKKKTKYYSTDCAHIPCLLYPSVCRQARRLCHIVAFVSNAAMNMGHRDLFGIVISLPWICTQKWGCWIPWYFYV